MIRMGVSEWVFLLVPAYPGSPGPKAIKRLVAAYPGSPGPKAIKRLCVCVCVCGPV